jgi:serine/threonine-protein kinase
MKRATRRRWAPVCAIVCTLAAARPAHAQGADQKAAAQVLFEQGRALVEQGHYGEACPKFAESLRFDRGIGTMLWLADCYESNGQTASAWASFKEAAAAAALVHDAREKVARDRVAKLEPKLTTVAILVPPEAAVRGLEVRRDGVTLGPSEWGIGVPVDPGIHAIEVSAPERKSWTTSIQLPAKPGLVSVTVPVLEPAPQAAPAHAPEARDPASASEADAPPPAMAPTWSTQRIAGAVVAGAGVISLGVALYLGLDAKSTYDASNSGGHCVNNQCDPQGLEDRSSAHSQATVSTVLVGVGLAAAAGGAVLYFTAPRERTLAGLGVAPMVASGGGGLVLLRSW